MPSITPPADPSLMWRSLDELSGSPRTREFLEKEFVDYSPEAMLRPSRRQFLKVLGASTAMASLTGCRWPREEILPHGRLPENRIPGEPVKFATAFEINGYGFPVLATSVDGRPTKLDGNDTHPLSRGSSNTFVQAALLSLYDPDRSQAPMSQLGRQAANAPAGFASFVEFAGPFYADLRHRQGAGLVVLAAASDSPVLADMRARLLQSLPKAEWFGWSPLPMDAVAAGTKLAFGRPLRPMLQLQHARVIVSLDDDFLFHHPASVRYARDFAGGRRPRDGKLSRLYAVDGSLSLTATLADIRETVRPSEIGALVAALIGELGTKGLAGAADLANKLGAAPSQAVKALVGTMARDLYENRGQVAITAGAHLPPEVHAACAWLNATLNGVGKDAPVVYLPDPRGERTPAVAAIQKCAERLNAGGVEALIMLGGNPAYDAPADVRFAEAIGKAKTSIHLSDYDDETSRRCTWHVNRAHFLESWDAAASYDGTISIVQPLIAPLYNGLTAPELLAQLIGDGPQRAYELTQRALRETLTGGTAAVDPSATGAAAEIARGLSDFELRWNRALHSGFIALQNPPLVEPTLAEPAWAGGLMASSGAASDFELVFKPDYSVNAGEFANNAWLQELPDPLTKLTWDNAALIAPADANRLGVKTGGNLKIDQGGASLVLPAFVMPGHVAGAVSLLLGYGRKQGGDVAGVAGFDVYPLRRSDAMGFATGAKVSAAGGSYQLVTAQDHHLMQSDVAVDEIQRRIPELVRSQTIESFNHDPKHPHHVVHLPVLESLWEERKYSGHQWGMGIDLSTCIACSACVVACQAENNIPVVGKDEVEFGREMHWIRIDRYFEGTPDNPHFRHQPVTCHHCEMAPCESVCPVAATVHDSDGINVMVYNRCIGTRYCSNNCPYKVRRFNWFFNHHGPKHPRSLMRGKVGFPDWRQPSLVPQRLLTDIEKMHHNPEVTVRSRGVMEKCTFCYQRIAKAKIAARNAWVATDPAARREDWRVPDGTIKTACQDACPTSAIVFGDLSDPNSEVSKWHRDARAYQMLAQLNVKPRLAYLTRITNPGSDAAHAHTGHDHGSQSQPAQPAGGHH